jgi:4-carboxymuconolactone decarboxylase
VQGVEATRLAVEACEGRSMHTRRIQGDRQMTSAARNRKLPPVEFDAEQRALYDSIVNGPRARQANSVPLVDDEGCLEGPFNLFLLRPILGQQLQALGAALRYESRLSSRWREIAILVVAARKAADFESYVHEPIAKSLGLTSEQLAAIRAEDYGVLDAGDAVIARVAREMLNGEALSDETFVELHALIGEAQVFELATIIGYYALLAIQLSVFQVPLPEQARSAL